MSVPRSILMRGRLAERPSSIPAEGFRRGDLNSGTAMPLPREDASAVIFPTSDFQISIHLQNAACQKKQPMLNSHYYLRHQFTVPDRKPALGAG